MSNKIFLQYYTPIKYTKTWQIHSISLNKNFNLHGSGSWLLGYRIDGNSVASYYVYTEDKNGLKLFSCKANDVYIKETNNIPAYIDEFEVRKYKYPFFTVDCDNPNASVCQYNHKYTLEVPKNTIKLKFDVNQFNMN